MQQPQNDQGAPKKPPKADAATRSQHQYAHAYGKVGSDGKPIDNLPLRVTLKAFWLMLKSYWGCRDSLKSWFLLALILGLTGGSVYIATTLNTWYKTFWDTIQEYDLDGFKEQLVVFVIIATINVLVVVYNAYLKSCLAINWRKWLTGKTTTLSCSLQISTRITLISVLPKILTSLSLQPLC